jgi:hypothetical protein
MLDPAPALGGYFRAPRTGGSAFEDGGSPLHRGPAPLHGATAAGADQLARWRAGPGGERGTCIAAPQPVPSVDDGRAGFGGRSIARRLVRALCTPSWRAAADLSGSLAFAARRKKAANDTPSDPAGRIGNWLRVRGDFQSSIQARVRRSTRPVPQGAHGKRTWKRFRANGWQDHPRALPFVSRALTRYGHIGAMSSLGTSATLVPCGARSAIEAVSRRTNDR